MSSSSSSDHNKKSYQFSLIVFSKKYASSSWCLDELVKIMECQKKTTDQSTVFPVFYDVEPTEVRYQSGSVGEAFAKHTIKEARHTSKKIGEWRKALKDAANLSGWELKNTADGHEAKVIKLIVEQISLELRSVNSGVDENLIGIERRIQALDPCLEIGSDDVRMIGIKGMGGAGKTTLACAIFDKISFHFEGKSFVENVREKSKVPLLGLEKLQEQVLTDVLKDKSISVSSVHVGTNLMKTMLCGKKVLVVLDDVDHINQLEALAADPSWFKQGSRIIITTRDEQVLIANGVRFIQDVHLLSDEEATRLFSRYAFREAFPTHEYETQSLRQVLRYAAGLPLTIKVLGSHLCGKSKPEWTDALSRLENIPLEETIKKLEISYDSLENEYKEIFLDVACFCRYMEKDKAITMLEGCGYYARNGLKVLQQKSLITFNGRNWIMMHDHIEEMGKNIVRRDHLDEPHKHSRLWVQEEIEHLLANNLGSEATRCIDMDYKHGVVLENLRKMKKLRCLTVQQRWKLMAEINYEPREYFPNSLQYLSWIFYPHWCLPKTFEADHLVTLDMLGSKIEQLWNEGRVMKKLKFLFLGSSHLKSLDIGLMPNLERLNLEHCSYLEKLYVHDGCLTNLVYLNLSRCRKLKSLDLGLMPNLERLNLEYCYDLVKLDVHGGCLKSLVYLNLLGCKSLKSFLFIELLESLEFLYLNGCNLKEFPNYIITGQCNNSLLELLLSGNSHIEELPSSIGNLHNLVSLNIHGYRRLKILPSSICSLQHLRTLELQHTSIKELPYFIGQLECLKKLDLSGSHLERLPGSICKLKHLKNLILYQCELLEMLPDDVGQLESLEELNLAYCSRLRDIPSNICKLKLLKDLKLYGCRRLEKLPHDMGNLQCLQILDIRVTCITHLPPNISLLKGLKIYISEVYADFIQLCFCYEFREPQIQGFQQLRTLNLERCGIKEVPEALGHLELLERLNLSYTDVKNLPDSICMLKRLKNLILESCVLLQKLPDNIGELESLEGLYLGQCYSIRESPSSICMLKQLKFLSFWHCFCLEKLPEEIGQLESLEMLFMRRCYNIRQIPKSICLSKKLKILDLEGCRRLEKLPDDIGYLQCLRALNIWNTAISPLPQSIFLLNTLKLYGFMSTN
ncbi:hypothetical protein R6Q59_002279 [Mikania micrantha]